ncbi:MAG: hypothetical protein H7259_10865 [Cytophagales bacterium]|nr:hypothetical protein [Cytophaga sp.]
MKTTLTTLILATASMLSSCKKDDNDVTKPADINETEVITTVALTFKDQATNAKTIFAFRDLDGDGGNNPTVDTIRLSPNKEYTVTVVVLDETKKPADTTSIEIEKEKNLHQFFYRKIGTYDLTTTYLDFDDHNVPVGLSVKASTGAAFTVKTNQLRVTLKHQPDVKPTSGNGNITLGETDVDVYFPIRIQ